MHADHITGTGHLKKLLPGSVSVISGTSGAKADHHLYDDEVLQFGRHEIKATSTPGHTNGCMTFIVHEQVCVSFYDLYIFFLLMHYKVLQLKNKFCFRAFIERDICFNCD